MLLTMDPSSVAVIALLLVADLAAVRGKPPGPPGAVLPAGPLSDLAGRVVLDDNGLQRERRSAVGEEPGDMDISALRRLLLGNILLRDLRRLHDDVALASDASLDYDDDQAVPAEEGVRTFIVNAPKRGRCPPGKQYQGKRCREEWRLE